MIDRLVAKGVLAIGVTPHEDHLECLMVITSTEATSPITLINPDKPGESFRVSGIPINVTSTNLSLTLET